jgi:hypothetical protein
VDVPDQKSGPILCAPIVTNNPFGSDKKMPFEKLGVLPADSLYKRFL